MQSLESNEYIDDGVEAVRMDIAARVNDVLSDTFIQGGEVRQDRETLGLQLGKAIAAERGLNPLDFL